MVEGFDFYPPAEVQHLYSYFPETINEGLIYFMRSLTLLKLNGAIYIVLK